MICGYDMSVNAIPLLYVIHLLACILMDRFSLRLPYHLLGNS